MKDIDFKKKPRYLEIQDEIRALPGMKEIKDQVEGLVADAISNKARVRAGLQAEPMSNNMLLTGNPGTGKTTVTKKVGQLMYELGMVSSPEVVSLTRSDLVGEFLNTAAQTTYDAITANKGKVIFIDEAYALYNGPQDLEGRQALDELMRLSEEYRGDTAIVLAGYGEQMDRLLEVNPGLKSRFPNHLNLPDYTPEEKTQVLHYIVETNNRTYANKAVKRRAGQYAAMMPSGGAAGNARAIRNYYEKLQRVHAIRTVKEGAKPDPIALNTFKMADVDAAAKSMGLPPIITARRTKKTAAPNRAGYRQRKARSSDEVVAGPGVARNSIAGKRPGTGTADLGSRRLRSVPV